MTQKCYSQVLIQKKWKHISTQKPIYSSFIHKCQELGTLQCPLPSDQRNKLQSTHTVEHSSTTADTCDNMGESKMHDTKWNSQIQKTTYCMIPYIRLSGRSRTLEIKISSCQGPNMERRNWQQRGTRELSGMMKQLYMLILLVVIQLYSLVKIHKIIHWKGKLYCM